MPAFGELRTGAWYGDKFLQLELPEEWDVTTLWPDVPPPLDDNQIAEALEHPVGQPPIRELALGKSRPVIVVDDLTRPTPASRVIPHVLEHFQAAGIAKEAVTIVMGTGTHGPPGPGGVEKKVGAEATAGCRLAVHRHTGELTRVGRTSFGTPVIVNEAVAASDFLVGIGGVYPQNSTGFGGGAKLALGVLGKRSISRLHFGHTSVDGSYEIENDFRRDLSEIAKMIGLNTTIAVHVNADREVVRIVSGDHGEYYRKAVAFSRQRYKAPLPADADVVICNAHPDDVSVTMARIKGIIPLLHAKPGASRVMVAGCPEGVGHHDLFPFIGAPRFTRERNWVRRAVARPRAVPRKAARKAWQQLARSRARGGGVTSSPTFMAQADVNPIWLYVPGEGAADMPAVLPGMKVLNEWESVLETVAREQGTRTQIKVVIYPCAPLHVLDLGQAG